MGMGITRTLSTGTIPVWQGTTKDIQLVQGGFKLDPTGYTTGDILPAGTPMVYNEATRVATALKTGIAQANAASNAVNYTIVKGHTLKLGDYLASGATGGKAYAITAIDTTSSSVYDTITVGTTIGAVTAGDTFYASSATGATASALPASNGLLYAETRVDAAEDVSVVIRGTVYARRVPYSAAIAALTGLSKIIYSQSF